MAILLFFLPSTEILGQLPNGRKASIIDCGLILDSLISFRNGQQLEALVDKNAFLSRSLSALPLPTEEKRQLYGSFADWEVFGALKIFIANGGSVEVANAYTLPGKELLLLRLLSVNGGLNYQELLLLPEAGCRIIDIYDFRAGQWQSRLLGKTVAMQYGYAPQGQQQLAFWQLLSDAQGQMAEGNYTEASNTLAQIPKKWRNSREELRLRIQIAQEQENRADESIFAQYERLYGTDPALELLRLQWLLNRPNITATIGQVNRLIGMLGDPYLWLLKATLQVEAGNTTAARSSLTHLLGMGEQEIEARLMLIDMAYKEDNFKEISVQLDSLSARTGLPASMILPKEEYPLFFIDRP